MKGILGQCDGLHTAHRQGRPHPHPDMMCNKLVKFGYFEGAGAGLRRYRHRTLCLGGGEGWKTVARHRRRSGEGPDRLSRKDILRPAPPSYLPARAGSPRARYVASPKRWRSQMRATGRALGHLLLRQDQLQRLHRAPSRHTSGTGDREIETRVRKSANTAVTGSTPWDSAKVSD